MNNDLLTYLLLDYVVELRATFAQLASKDAAELFNKPSHGLSIEQLNRKLKDMRALELIKIAPYKHNDNQSILLDAVISLTSKGGLVWEKRFNPDWQKYIMLEVDIKELGVDHIRIESLNLDKLMEIKKSASSVTYPVVMKTLHPWNALYWKQFEEGFSLEFKAQYDALSELFHQNICCEWYEKTKNE